MPRESMRGQSDSQQTQKNDGDADDDRGCGDGPMVCKTGFFGFFG